MGTDIEATPHARHISGSGEVDANSLKAPTKVGRQELADIVRPLESYEGYHRFDPYASWSIEEERNVVRKTDLRLLTWLCLMMFGYALRSDHISFADGGGKMLYMLTLYSDFSSIAGTCRTRLRITC
jgi:hypothetical protein